MAHILVVDDEEDIVDLVSYDLTARGHRVVTATSGAAALKEIDAATFDVVITDLMMPEVSGLDVCKRLETKQPGALVILISGFSDSEVKVSTNQAVHRIRKPFSLEDVAQLIATFRP